MPLLTEDEKALFNIHCKVQLPLESLEYCCGWEKEGMGEFSVELSGFCSFCFQCDTVVKPPRALTEPENVPDGVCCSC